MFYTKINTSPWCSEVLQLETNATKQQNSQQMYFLNF